MAQRTRLKADGRFLPRAHGLFLVVANGLPVRRDGLIAMTAPTFKEPGIRLVAAGEMPSCESMPRNRRSIFERISRAIRAFKAN